MILTQRSPATAYFVQAEVTLAKDRAAEIRAGLAQHPKTLPCELLYDEHGCRLFDIITELDEYYPSRTEMGILRSHIDEIADAIGPVQSLIEYGSGSSTKTRTLLDHLRSLKRYLPIDISPAYLEQARKALAVDYPALEVHPILADFSTLTRIPQRPGSRHAKSAVVFFPGSTIGNLSPMAAQALLEKIRRLLPRRGHLLIGVDVKKDPEILRAAYNDARGVTAAFNLNILERLNREFEANFRIDNFKHSAFFNPNVGRVEMHLVSHCNQAVGVAGRHFFFKKGESIHTENSYKYEPQRFVEIARLAGFTQAKTWLDASNLFSVHLLS